MLTLAEAWMRSIRHFSVSRVAAGWKVMILSTMNHWKNTIGNIDTRTPLWNIWGYNATHGLGYHEYLQLAEDLGAEPLFCINAGISHKEVVPLDQMGQWVQDALDAIEYANGPVNFGLG